MSCYARPRRASGYGASGRARGPRKDHLRARNSTEARHLRTLLYAQRMRRWTEPEELWWAPPDKPLSSDEYIEFITPYYLMRSVPFVAHSTIKTRNGDTIEVSTVFLRHNHAFMGGPPILWETMIFGPIMDLDQWRYYSPEEATVGHHNAVRLVWMALDAIDNPEIVTVTSRGTWWKDPHQMLESGLYSSRT